jgi:hypothetical protein
MNNTLTDLYILREIKPIKSHRFDCIASTGNYQPFETIADKAKVKRFYCYYNGVPNTFNSHAHMAAEKTITCTKNISSVYTPDLDTPLLGYGDTAHTNDALLFVFSSDYKQIELFVARGMRNHSQQLFKLLKNGQLRDDMSRLRQQVKPTNADTQQVAMCQSLY